MKKNIKTIFTIIIIAIIIILGSNLESYALDWTKVQEYNKGTLFKVTKNDSGFKKGDIVEYTGEWKKGGFFLLPDYYVEVKKDNNKKYVKVNYLEEYKTNRPKTLKEFINEHSEIKNATSLEDLFTKINISAGEAYESKYKGLDEEIDKAKGWCESITNDIRFPTKDSQKEELERRYKSHACNQAASDEHDSRFLALAYTYAWKYKEIEKGEQDYGNDNKNTDWKAEFEKAYKNYKNAPDDLTRKAAQKRMIDTLQKMGDEGIYDGLSKKEKEEITKKMTEVNNDVKKREDEAQKKADDKAKEGTVYKAPKKTSSGDKSEESLDDMVSDADSFVQKGSGDIKYDKSALQNFSRTFYNIMLTVGIFVAVIIGGILGIKFMVSGIEEKAEVKKMLIIYLVGCIVVFGGFAIWKLVVNIMQNVWG